MRTLRDIVYTSPRTATLFINMTQEISQTYIEPNYTDACSQTLTLCSLQSAMPREFLMSSRSCYEPGHDHGIVSRCAFHPSEPVLACAIEGGRVCVYEGSIADGSIVPFSQWQETILSPATQYPARCLEWNVSLSAAYRN